MIRDVFYFGNKPNAHPRERFVKDLDEAYKLATTEHFWVINEFCDYRNFNWDFDFDLLADEDVWAQEHINVWPSQWQKDSGTWLCSTEPTEIRFTIYRGDVNSVKRKNEFSDKYVIKQSIEIGSFDFSWHPDPTDPPYIYVWGNQHWGPEIMPTVEYHVDGATDYKYMFDQVPKLVQQPDKFKLFRKVKNFDYSWVPNPKSPPYNYVWGNKWVAGTLEPTVIYYIDGATDFEYFEEHVAIIEPDYDKWVINHSVDKTKFDLSWIPDPREPAYIYVWGNKWVPGELRSTLEYHCPGATEVKYMSEPVPLVPDDTKWVEHEAIDKSKFDFTWMPDPREPAYIYVWGNKWVSGELRPSLEYHCPGATERKYMSELVPLLPNYDNWKEYEKVDKTKFDFTWMPDPREPAYIYVWGNKWVPGELRPTLEYHMDGATERKYMSELVPLLPNYKNWIEKIPVDRTKFDFTWMPDPREPDFIYVWGNQWNSAEKEPTLEYHCPGATQYKYMHETVATVLPTTEHWENLLEVKEFDYSWRPDPGSPNYVYVFGNEWNSCYDEPTVIYKRDKDSHEIHYVDNIIAKLKPQPTLPEWETIIPVKYFDYSWRPHPLDPPFIYVFGNKFNNSQAEPTVLYKVEGATEYKFMDQPVALTQADTTNWQVSESPEYVDFDYSWRPDPTVEPAIYKWENNGPIYNTPGGKVTVKMKYTDLHKVTNVEETVEVNTTKEETVSLPQYQMFFVDKGNIESQQRFEQLKKDFPELQKTRYLNTWVDTISRCVNKAETQLFWVLSSELDYTNFKFDFNPNPWQQKMIHVFGTQWSHWGNTYLVNRDTFLNDTKYVKIIEHLNILNFVKDKKARATDCLYNVMVVDFGNSHLDKVKRIVQSKIGDKKIDTIEFDNSYLQTFKNILSKLPESPKEHYLWICSSVCDYTLFDFTYICDPFAREQLHVFPSEHQKYGDTFLVNVNKLRELIKDIDVLEDYNKVNFNEHQRVKRLPAPQYITQEDTHTDIIKKTDFDFPYAVFTTYDNKQLSEKTDKEPISLWQPDHRVVLSTSTGSSRIVVPKDIKSVIKREFYDYPYIKTSNKLDNSNVLDVVFLSNGERCAENNFEYLKYALEGKPNKITRIDGVNGRVEAYHACANASSTPWFFTVFAKLMVNPDFDWNWQPDRLQVPKHYIFNATNPLNGLCYGHQAMIAYNKNLVLRNRGRGLDFTLDDAHESVDIDSGIATFNTDEFSTWRTSFREAIKLKVDVDYNNDPVAKERLEVWSTVAEGDHAKWALRGVKDAIDYFNEVDGDVFELRESYEWAWCRQRFDSLYK